MGIYSSDDRSPGICGYCRSAVSVPCYPDDVPLDEEPVESVWFFCRELLAMVEFGHFKCQRFRE